MSERAERFVEHARRYGELGWALVRLEGKVPKGRDWQLAEVDRDPEHLAGLWAEWGERWNVGAVLGPSGLAVVEYDSEQGAAKLRELLGGRPTTPTARTGSGRLHFYFQAPAELEKRARDGLELRAGPHQCVVPPSEHPDTGEPYTWLEGREPWALPLAEVPAAVLEFFREQRRNGGPAEPLPEIIPIGRIDDTLASLAGTMRRRGASEEAIYSALVAELERCEPGHTHTEADCRRIARSIAKKAPAPVDSLDRLLPRPEPAPPPAEPVGRAWLTDAAELLAEPDPGPTPWLIEDLIVEAALVACVGRWKTTKSYALLHMCIAVATGRPAFGAFAIPEPGPVVFCNEESGRAALWRRLDALARGSAIDPEELRGRLLVAPNAGIKLDDPGWQDELVAIGRDLRPRLFGLDPLARMKAAARDENAQAEMGALIEFIRHLREESGAAVGFVHHTGHLGAHMRGSSDLESVWESRLTWTRDGQALVVGLESEHREAEASAPISYRISWDGDTRSMRFELIEERGPDLTERLLEHLREHGPGTTDEVRKGVGVRRSDVLRTLEELEKAGTVHRGPSGRRDKAGRAIRDKVWNLSSQAGLWPVPEDGTTQDDPHAEHRGPSHRPDIKRGAGTDGPPGGPPDDRIPF